MNPIFKKLNVKDQEELFVLGAPTSFEKDMNEMKGVTSIKTNLGSCKSATFILGFATKQKEVDELARKACSILDGDGMIWIAYPKGTSKKYKCEFNRDNGWTEMGKQGFEPVRMVAIDDDWSALRFRRVENIKTMTRSFALTDAGKKRTAVKKTTKK